MGSPREVANSMLRIHKTAMGSRNIKQIGGKVTHFDTPFVVSRVPLIFLSGPVRSRFPAEILESQIG